MRPYAFALINQWVSLEENLYVPILAGVCCKTLKINNNLFLISERFIRRSHGQVDCGKDLCHGGNYVHLYDCCK